MSLIDIIVVEYIRIIVKNNEFEESFGFPFSNVKVLLVLFVKFSKHTFIEGVLLSLNRIQFEAQILIEMQEMRRFEPNE